MKPLTQRLREAEAIFRSMSILSTKPNEYAINADACKEAAEFIDRLPTYWQPDGQPKSANDK